MVEETHTFDHYITDNTDISDPMGLSPQEGFEHQALFGVTELEEHGASATSGLVWAAAKQTNIIIQQ